MRQLEHHQGGPTVLRKALLIVSSASMFIMSAAWGYVFLELREVRKEHTQLSADLMELQAVSVQTTQKTNFLQKLKPPADRAEMTSKIQKQVVSHGLRLSAMDVREHPISAKQLAHLEWDLKLKGTYPQIKSALAQTLSDSPYLRIKTLTLKQASANDLDAQVALVVWLNPANDRPSVSIR